MTGIQRSPVLAHERFVADRASFQGLGLASRFDRIARTNLWGAETSRSGLGSEPVATAAVSKALQSVLKQLGARSLLDAPCGEVSWIAGCIEGLDYTGIDIVPTLTAANRARAERDNLIYRGHYA